MKSSALLIALFMVASAVAQQPKDAAEARQISIRSIRSSVKYCHSHPEGKAWIYDNISVGELHGWRWEYCSTFADEVKDVFPEVLPAKAHNATKQATR